jgi:hypothetical protein
VTGVVASALLLAGTLVACGGDDNHVSVSGFHVVAADRAACEKLLAAVPGSVADQSRRDVSGSAYAAAWGDPAIVLRCGVGKPKGFDRFSRCQRANGVDWFVPESVIGDLEADAVMTTVGRSPAVEVELPARYRPAGSAAVMVDLAPVLKAHTTKTTPCT